MKKIIWSDTMSQSDILNILFNVGVTDNISTSITMGALALKLGRLKLTPTERYCIRKLVDTEELLVCPPPHDRRGYCYVGGFYFNSKVYKLLKKQYERG